MQVPAKDVGKGATVVGMQTVELPQRVQALPIAAVLEDVQQMGDAGAGGRLVRRVVGCQGRLAPSVGKRVHFVRSHIGMADRLNQLHQPRVVVLGEVDVEQTAEKPTKFAPVDFGNDADPDGDNPPPGGLEGRNLLQLGLAPPTIAKEHHHAAYFAERRSFVNRIARLNRVMEVVGLNPVLLELFVDLRDPGLAFPVRKKDVNRRVVLYRLHGALPILLSTAAVSTLSVQRCVWGGDSVSATGRLRNVCVVGFGVIEHEAQRIRHRARPGRAREHHQQTLHLVAEKARRRHMQLQPRGEHVVVVDGGILALGLAAGLAQLRG